MAECDMLERVALTNTLLEACSIMFFFFIKVQWGDESKYMPKVLRQRCFVSCMVEICQCVGSCTKRDGKD